MKRKSFKRDLVKALLESQKMEEAREEIRKRKAENNRKTKIWIKEGTNKPHTFDRARHPGGVVD